MRLVDKCHADATVKRNRMITGCHLTNLHSMLVKHRIACPRNSFVENLNADKLLIHAFNFLTFNYFLTYKLHLVGLYEHAERSLNRSRAVVQFVSVERQSSLETQSVAATEPARFHTRLLEQRPDVHNRLIHGINLESVFSCVACSADNQPFTLPLKFAECVELKL